MTQLTIYADNNPNRVLRQTEDAAEIASHLKGLGARFDRWPASAVLAPDASAQDVLMAYAPQIERLKQEHGYQTADVIRLTQTPPNVAELRQKFLAEHTHSEDEVRFFVDGSGLFVLHAQGRVHALLCEKNDLLSVPAGLAHWFDMGSSPSFTCIRLFTDPTGWLAEYTGDGIAKRFPVLDSFLGGGARLG